MGSPGAGGSMVPENARRGVKGGDASDDASVEFPVTEDHRIPLEGGITTDEGKVASVSPNILSRIKQQGNRQRIREELNDIFGSKTEPFLRDEELDADVDELVKTVKQRKEEYEASGAARPDDSIPLSVASLGKAAALGAIRGPIGGTIGAAIQIARALPGEIGGNIAGELAAEQVPDHPIIQGAAGLLGGMAGGIATNKAAGLIGRGAVKTSGVLGKMINKLPTPGEAALKIRGNPERGSALIPGGEPEPPKKLPDLPEDIIKGAPKFPEELVPPKFFDQMTDKELLNYQPKTMDEQITRGIEIGIRLEPRARRLKVYQEAWASDDHAPVIINAKGISPEVKKDIARDIAAKTRSNPFGNKRWADELERRVVEAVDLQIDIPESREFLASQKGNLKNLKDPSPSLGDFPPDDQLRRLVELNPISNKMIVDKPEVYADPEIVGLMGNARELHVGDILPLKNMQEAPPWVGHPRNLEMGAAYIPGFGDKSKKPTVSEEAKRVIKEPLTPEEQAKIVNPSKGTDLGEEGSNLLKEIKNTRLQDWKDELLYRARYGKPIHNAEAEKGIPWAKEAFAIEHNSFTPEKQELIAGVLRARDGKIAHVPSLEGEARKQQLRIVQSTTEDIAKLLGIYKKPSVFNPGDVTTLIKKMETEIAIMKKYIKDVRSGKEPPSVFGRGYDLELADKYEKALPERLEDLRVMKNVPNVIDQFRNDLPQSKGFSTEARKSLRGIKDPSPTNLLDKIKGEIDPKIRASTNVKETDEGNYWFRSLRDEKEAPPEMGHPRNLEMGAAYIPGGKKSKTLFKEKQVLKNEIRDIIVSDLTMKEKKVKATKLLKAFSDLNEQIVEKGQPAHKQGLPQDIQDLVNALFGGPGTVAAKPKSVLDTMKERLAYLTQRRWNSPARQEKALSEIADLSKKIKDIEKQRGAAYLPDLPGFISGKRTEENRKRLFVSRYEASDPTKIQERLDFEVAQLHSARNNPAEVQRLKEEHQIERERMAETSFNILGRLNPHDPPKVVPELPALVHDAYRNAKLNENRYNEMLKKSWEGIDIASASDKKIRDWILDPATVTLTPKESVAAQAMADRLSTLETQYSGLHAAKRQRLNDLKQAYFSTEPSAISAYEKFQHEVINATVLNPALNSAAKKLLPKYSQKTGKYWYAKLLLESAHGGQNIVEVNNILGKLGANEGILTSIEHNLAKSIFTGNGSPPLINGIYSVLNNWSSLPKTDFFVGVGGTIRKWKAINRILKSEGLAYIPDVKFGNRSVFEKFMDIWDKVAFGPSRLTDTFGRGIALIGMRRHARRVGIEKGYAGQELENFVRSNVIAHVKEVQQTSVGLHTAPILGANSLRRLAFQFFRAPIQDIFNTFDRVIKNGAVKGDLVPFMKHIAGVAVIGSMFEAMGLPIWGKLAFGIRASAPIVMLAEAFVSDLIEMYESVQVGGVTKGLPKFTFEATTQLLNAATGAPAVFARRLFNVVAPPGSHLRREIEKTGMIPHKQIPFIRPPDPVSIEGFKRIFFGYSSQTDALSKIEDAKRHPLFDRRAQGKRMNELFREARKLK